MDENDRLAERFETHRPHLRAVAYRMLGSVSEADDAVRESWLRLGRTDTSDIQNLGGWLTTVVARVSLDQLRSRASRRADSLEARLHGHGVDPTDAIDPEHEARLADSVGAALLMVLDTLTPAERLAFVLHDMFAVPFDEIAPVVGRSPDAAQQLASRARRRVQAAATVPAADPTRQRRVVEAFLAASREGDVEALHALLDPDVVLRADAAAVQAGAPELVVGAQDVADTFSGRARAARPAVVNGAVGAVWSHAGRPRVVFDFTVIGGAVVEIGLSSDPERLRELQIELLDE